jgi:hypothetical protein
MCYILLILLVILYLFDFIGFILIAKLVLSAAGCHESVIATRIQQVFARDNRQKARDLRPLSALYTAMASPYNRRHSGANA